ncbi:PKD domain-containing protein [Geomesophilobacter sediminis]|uniref:PKD/Chitinase domain-containing protein n=1 Tax=Geomesophilobacter sediminis TaxID=2798584 RepID=A0A8J7M283_9BACT|nr:hypothetical protein [Geomesophilobacter sediminis]MBJ6727332.1 hypothetical protein [Geomesophilobacter sediminis]
MVKRFLAALMVMVILPVAAHGASWFFNTQAKNAGGVINSRNMLNQTSTAGSVFKSYTTHAQLPVTVVANVGYTIRDVTVNGVSNPNPPSPFSTTVQGFNQQTVTATFLVNTLSVTASAGYGGSVTPTSVGNIYYGTKVASAMRFTFTPISRYNVASITGVPAGATVSAPLPAAPNTSVTVTFPVGYVFTSNVALSGTFTGPPVAVIANPGTVLPGTPVTLDGTGSTGAISSWSWTQISGPVKLFPDATQGSTFTVTPTVVGTYGIQLTVTGGSVATTNLIVTDDPAAAARNQCQNCHQGNGIGTSVGVFGHWSSSTHRAKMVLCVTCHYGTGPINHPGAYTSGMVSETTFVKTYGGDNFCLNGTCHNPGVTHKTSGMACAYCHNSGDLHYPDTTLAQAMSQNVCFKCHGAVNTTHYFTKVSLANDCLKCHNNGWDPHAQTKATFFPAGVVVPPAHFNGYTSFANPSYAAAYVTAATACANCHKGGDPNDAADKNDVLKQYRNDWAGSAHGDVKGGAWLNSATHNWKASGQAGVDISQAGNPTDCQRCHTAKGYALYNISSSIAPIDPSKPINSEPLTCDGCHNPDFTVRSIAPRTAYYNYSSPATGKLLVSRTFPDSGFSNVCLGCHTGRQAGATISAMAAAVAAQGTAAADSFWGNVSFVNSHYLAAGGEVFRTIGYEYPGAVYGNAVDHSLVNNGSDGPCVTCHMQQKDLAAHSHTLNPAVAGYAACKGCHAQSVGNFDADFPGFVQTKSANFQAALQALGNALSQKGFAPNLVNGQLAYPYFNAKNWGTGATGPGNMGAAFNYSQLMHDPGAFAHNPTYVKRLVRDSLDYLVNGSVDRSRKLTATDFSNLLPSDPTAAGNAYSFVLESSNGSSACAACHGSSIDPAHQDPIVATYNNSKHSYVNGGASCGDCHLPTGTTSMAHPPQFQMYSSAASIAVNCYNCHTTVDPTFNKTTHAWPSRGLCMECHNPHNPWPPAMNIYPHFSSYSTAQYIMAGSPNTKNGNSCKDCHYQAGNADIFTVFSANRQWARSGHGDPKGAGYVGPGPVTEASLEAYDFKFLGTAAAPAVMAANTNPASAATKDCARCHTSTGFINFVTPTDPNDPTTALKNMAAWGSAGDRSREMVSCPTCHTPAPFSDSFSRRPVGLSYNNGVNDIAAVVAYFNYSSKATKLIKRSKIIFDPANLSYLGPGDSNLCIACHAGRAAGDLIKTTVTSCTNSPTIACRLGNGNQTQGATNNAANTDPAFWSNVDFIDPHRGTTVNMMYPDNLRPAYEYRGSTTASTYHLNIGYDNPDAPQGPCVGCHMASADKKHAFSPLSTATNGAIGGVTTDLCYGCHGPGGAFDFGTNLSTLQTKKTGYFAALSFIKAQLAAKNIFYNAEVAPYFFKTADAAQQSYANRVTNWYFFDTALGKAFQGADLMGAAFNLRLLDSDNGWVHNGTYSRKVLFDTIDYLDDGNANSVYTTLTTSTLSDAATRLNAQVYIFGNTTNQSRPSP